MTGNTARAIVALISLLACLTVPGQVAAQVLKPNIILIIGDDLGWPDFGFMPSSRTLNTNQGSLPMNQIVQTPSLDALAAGGVVFRNGQVTSSVCLTSLRTLLTSAGMQPFQWSDTRSALAALPQITLPDNPPFYFPRVEVEYIRTLPKDLSHAGYQSWEGGKYWEGAFSRAGFSHGLALTDTGLIGAGWDFGRTGWSPALCGPDGDPYIPCPALDPLRTFLDEVEVEDKPFFIWFAPQIPHQPFDAPQNFRDPYEALGLASCAEFDCSGNCASCANEVNYLANVSWLDGLVGELVDELERRNLRDNTLLIYVTDNGWGLNYQFAPGVGKGKSTLYEMGYRTPIIFNWPGHVPAGAAYDDLVSSTDIAPTILDFAGLDVLPEQEGLSLRQRIEGGPSTGRTELIGYDIGLNQEGLGHFLRTDIWRYIRFDSTGHEELYRIDIDPFEDNDLASQYPELLAQFSAMVDAWETDRRTAPPRVEITGRLLNATTGSPLTGSQLKLENGPFSLISIVGPDGWFRFGPVEPGNYLIRPELRVADLDWLGGGNPVPVQVPLATSGAFLNLTGTQPRGVSVPVGTQIRGTLTDSTGAPLANVPILVTGAIGCDAVRSQVSTQPNGSYQVDNLPFSTYTIKATTPAGLQDIVVGGVVINSLGVVTEDLVAYPE